MVLTCHNDREYRGILSPIDSEYVTVKTGKRGRPPRIYMDDIKLILVIPDAVACVPSQSPRAEGDDIDQEGPTLEDLAECEMLCDEALAEALY